MIRLYQNIHSPYSHRVRIVLKEKELDYQSVTIDLAKGENKTEQFLRLNPAGKVPVLADDDLILAESLVINEYLNEEYPYPELMPEEPQEKALVRLWSAQIDNMLADPFLNLFLGQMAKEKGESVDEVKLDSSRQLILKFLEVADRNLKGKEYLVGTYTLADVAFAPWVNKFEKFGITIPDTLTHTLAWMKRLATKHTVVSTREQ